MAHPNGPNAGWFSLEKKILRNASDIQRREMKKAFFAGFFQCFVAIMAISELDEEAALREMELINAEVDAYLKSVIEQANQEVENKQKPTM